MISIIFLILGFILLIKGSDLLVDGAASFAKKINVPDLVVGLTVVSFGTSIAELVVNISASINHNSEIVIGNILGSNIFNVSVILGVSAIIFPLTVKDNTIWKEIPFSILAAVAFIVLVNDEILMNAETSMLSRIDGFVLLVFFIGFLYYTVSLARKQRRTFEEETVYSKFSLKATVISIFLGLAGLIIGGKWVVSGSINLARMFNVSETLIGLTIVAAGTSLPELATSTVAAYKKKPDIAVANVVGSNIFNIFFILGLSALIYPVKFNVAQNFDAIICIVVSLIMFSFVFTAGRKRFDRVEGVILILLYFGYLYYLIIRG